MSTPIPDEQRAEVIDLARSGLSRNEVARRTGVSTASVSRICQAAGVTFDRTQTATAVEARVIDLQAGRVHLAGNLLDDITEARQRLREADDAREFFDLARSVGVLVNAHVRIIGVDGTEAGAEEAKSMLGNLMGYLRTQYQEQQEDDAVPAALLPADGDDTEAAEQ